MWRHGDVLIAQAEQIPSDAMERKGTVLAYGEVTGHSHRFAEAEHVQLWEHRGTIYIEVREQPATLMHEEHQSIVFEPGMYRVWMQREYTPQAIRRVID